MGARFGTDPRRLLGGPKSWQLLRPGALTQLNHFCVHRCCLRHSGLELLGGCSLHMPSCLCIAHSLLSACLALHCRHSLPLCHSGPPDGLASASESTSALSCRMCHPARWPLSQECAPVEIPVFLPYLTARALKRDYSLLSGQ